MPPAPNTPGKTKIAVLGGGAAAMATVWGITSSPDWDKRYEITVYQMGWRLGGKCASGRDPDNHYRNYEHGLHILGGFYHNSLRMLRECYGAWKTFPNHITFDDALSPQSLVHVADKVDGQWQTIACPFPTNKRELGVGETELRPYEAARALLEWIFGGSTAKKKTMHGLESALGASKNELTDTLSAIGAIMPPRDPIAITDAKADELTALLDKAISFTKKTDAKTSLEAMTKKTAADAKFDYWMMLQVGLVFARGIIADRLWLHGFDRVNNEDSLDWMRRHGASEEVATTVYCRAGYDYAFAYKDGDGSTWKNAKMAAGAGLRGTLRMMLTYHKAVFVHMNGGMGEIIFTPLYQVLKDRGVNFRFFHRIDALELDKTGHWVSAIRCTVQAKVKAGAANYDPLAGYQPPVAKGKKAKERKYWPLHPLYDQLDKPTIPAAHAEDVYEAPWSTTNNSASLKLERGKDFDVVVLGISVGALNSICTDLAAKHPRWKQMLAAQHAIQTISAQVWLSEATSALGWGGGPTVLTSFEQPYATWADMHHMVAYEADDGAGCKDLAYFCGTLPRVGGPMDDTYPAKSRAKLETVTRDWVNAHIETLWPGAVATPGGGFKTALELDRYVRANCLPSDGYVLSMPGSIDARMRTDETGIANLRLAGDWTRNGADTGSFENAVMSGLQCSRAICGHPKRIVGESDF